MAFLLIAPAAGCSLSAIRYAAPRRGASRQFRCEDPCVDRSSSCWPSVRYRRSLMRSIRLLYPCRTRIVPCRCASSRCSAGCFSRWPIPCGPHRKQLNKPGLKGRFCSAPASELARAVTSFFTTVSKPLDPDENLRTQIEREKAEAWAAVYAHKTTCTRAPRLCRNSGPSARATSPTSPPSPPIVTCRPPGGRRRKSAPGNATVASCSNWRARQAPCSPRSKWTMRVKWCWGPMPLMRAGRCCRKWSSTRHCRWPASLCGPCSCRVIRSSA